MIKNQSNQKNQPNQRFRQQLKQSQMKEKVRLNGTIREVIRETGKNEYVFRTDVNEKQGMPGMRNHPA